MQEKTGIAKSIAITLVLLIVSSAFLTYKVIMLDNDYEIFTNPDGPDTSDYFDQK